MKTLRIDIAADLAPDVLALLAKSGRVPVFSVDEEREVGWCDTFWVEGVELWSDLMLVEPINLQGMHAESVCSVCKCHGMTELHAVLLTSLPRGSLGAIMESIEAQRATWS